MHSRISALKTRSGVFNRQPYDSGLVSLYSAIRIVGPRRQIGPTERLWPVLTRFD
jgi:hypothetical protein